MKLSEYGVKVSVETFIKENTDHQVTLFNIYTNEEQVVDDVDAVVPVNVRRSVNTLADQLRFNVADVRALGDANAPGTHGQGHPLRLLLGWHL